MVSHKSRADTETEINLEILKWVSVLGPVVFLVLFEYFQQILLVPQMSTIIVIFVTVPLVLLAAVAFSSFIFSRFRRLERQIVAQRDRSEALLRVAQVLNASVDLETVLQTVVDQAREQLRADYGELHFIKKDTNLHGVCFSGIRKDECAVRDRPSLNGLNGEVLHTGQVLRVDDRRDHPSSVPLPEGHVEIGPFLGVPVIVRGRPRADILLVRGPDGAGFEAEDEEFLVGIANQAGVAIENARLIEREQQLAVLAERDRIAQEMHDGLAQMLGLIHLKTKTAEFHLSGDRPHMVCEELAQIAQSTQQTYAQVRRTIFDLRTTLSPDLSLEQALNTHIGQFSQMTGMRVITDLDGRDGKHNGHLVAETTAQLVRIVQEALHNVWKHAGTDEARVRLQIDDDGWCLTIEDHGLGFVPDQVDPNDPRHLGLQIMRQRAEKIGGRFCVESEIGQGTQVMVISSGTEI